MAISLPDAVEAVIEYRHMLTFEQMSALHSALKVPSSLQPEIDRASKHKLKTTRLSEFDLSEEFMENINAIKTLRDRLGTLETAAIQDQTRVLNLFTSTLGNLIKLKEQAQQIEDRHRLKEAVLAAISELAQEAQQKFIQRLNELTEY